MCLSQRINAPKLISGLWSGARGAALLHMGPFYSLLVAIYKHAKAASSPTATCKTNAAVHLSPNLDGGWVGEGHGFPACRGVKNCSCDNVVQCVLTIQIPTLGMSSRKSSHLDYLLMYCDSGCQQFSSTLSSCNFQPSPLHWYHFKSPLTISHIGAAGSIEGWLWVWCFPLCQSKERCFQNRCAAQLT